jgi:hypothetical protein
LWLRICPIESQHAAVFWKNAAVVDRFSDAVLKHPVVVPKSKNPQLRA